MPKRRNIQIHQHKTNKRIFLHVKDISTYVLNYPYYYSTIMSFIFKTNTEENIHHLKKIK